jgi:hypothetical protein
MLLLDDSSYRRSCSVSTLGPEYFRSEQWDQWGWISLFEHTALEIRVFLGYLYRFHARGPPLYSIFGHFHANNLAIEYNARSKFKLCRAIFKMELSNDKYLTLQEPPTLNPSYNLLETLNIYQEKPTMISRLM